MARAQARILAAGARALRPGGVLVYSTCTISSTENERLIAAFLDSHADFGIDDLAAELPAWGFARAMPSCGAAAARCLLTLPHRDRTAGFFIARMRRSLTMEGEPDTQAKRRRRPRAAVPELRRAVAAADEPPRPLPLRLLPAPLRADLRVPQLRRALDDRADVLDGDPQVQQLRRLDAAGRMSPDSGARPLALLEEVQVAPSILVADFGRLREQVEEVLAAGARVIHVDVMDGHFVPPITVGPLVVEALARAGRAGGRRCSRRT